MLVVTATVNEAEIIQELGGFAVVARSQENVSNPNIERVLNLSIMRDELGRLGVSDHSVLFSARRQFDVDSIASGLWDASGCPIRECRLGKATDRQLLKTPEH